MGFPYYPRLSTENRGLSPIIPLIRDWRKERTIYFAYGLALAFFTLLLVSEPILLHNTGWYQFCL